MYKVTSKQLREYHIFSDSNTYHLLGRAADTLEEIKKDLKYYLDTNEENGVVYIPKFVIEKIVNNA
jgi:hypothetical protein